MSKILIKLKDTSGSFYITSQNISVNGSKVVEVETDEIVNAALLNKGIVELSKDEAKEWRAAQAELEKSSDKTEDKKNDATAPVEFTKDNAVELFKKAVEMEKITEKDGLFSFGKKKFDSQDLLVEELVSNEKFRTSVTESLV